MEGFEYRESFLNKIEEAFVSERQNYDISDDVMGVFLHGDFPFRRRGQ